MILLLGIVIVIILLVIDWRIQSFFQYLNKKDDARHPLYPVFSRKTMEIEQINIESELASLTRLGAELKELYSREASESKPFKPSAEFRWAIKRKIEQEVSWERAVEDHHFMIEANIAVLNGGKISDFLGKWEERQEISRWEDRRKEVERRYAKWEKHSDKINKDLKRKRGNSNR